MAPGIVMIFLGGIFFFLWCVAFFLEFWRRLKEDEKALSDKYGEGWEVDNWDLGSSYFGQAPPANYANNDSTDYIY